MGPTDKPDKTRPADDPREAYEELPLISAKGSSNRPDQVRYLVDTFRQLDSFDPRDRQTDSQTDRQSVSQFPRRCEGPSKGLVKNYGSNHAQPGQG
ncbi:hypothetical protein An06g01790 [Aspergillus niger]|uniref:Uncharacterized protein n=2 Tax=Aspergillus niger TaxID=5061 RepID=A2QLM7_ASPNC|nr:hypothetical protein An06g01790 [Aspergillus niger]CAK48022.1 hypothetical protein An06g01790 [Aspergillus niger]